MKYFNKLKKTCSYYKFTKSIRIFIACFIILLFNGCGNENTKQNDSSEQNDTSTPQTQEKNYSENSKEESASPSKTETPNIDQENPSKNHSYKIITTDFVQNNINIQYPQIKGFGDDSDEKLINDMIKNDILDREVNNAIEFYQDENILSKLNVDITYQVTWSADEILSIMYTGITNIEGGIHPNNEFHAITIDLKNKKRLYLSNFVNIDSELIQKIKQSKTVTNQITESQDSDNNRQEIMDELISAIQDGDDSYTIWSLINESERNFYVTPNSIVVCLYVSHAAGDYALAEIPTENTVTTNTTYDSYLRLNDENLVVSFKMKDSKKIMSICISKDKHYIVYRFGTQDHIDLEYPQDKEDSWSKFTYTNYFHQDEPDNNRYDFDSLSFHNGGYKYEVYDQHDVIEEKTNLGIKVTNLKTGKKTNIIGDDGTLIGNWYTLTTNSKLNKQ